AEGVFVAEVLVLDLLREGGVAHDAVEGDEHRGEKGQLVNGGDFGLNEHVRLVGIDAAGEIVGGDVDDGLADVIGALGAGGEGVLVGDDEIAVVFVLEGQAVFDAADVVAEVELAGGG